MAKKLLRSPKGTAAYAWLTKPDTKFEPEGVYSVTLRLPVAEGKAFIASLKPLLDESLDAAKKAAKTPALAVKIKARAPFTIDDETGEYKFTFKAKAGGVAKTGKNAGKPWERGPIPVFDAQGKPMQNPKVGGGSIIKVSFETFPYYVAKDKEAGISLRLEAVQVLTLVEYTGRSAAGYGFEAEEGYDGDAAADAEDDTETTDENDGAEAGDDSDDF